ncbi:SAM-dependent methyltransferase [Salinisphaera hydrothermalis]|uniref:Ribosomal RNA methyltransferase FtsJ domain-containing protein n=1 Tax=Salinisphaera hydrothermalis (strain C41B8) TaxID=1304275 RepID=A0A084IHB6_SALHC|nr:SAM-dependent methyltransferase [Salinisphaera hydrothermalis]KEZ76100.1 hypothetical protein C41B8_16539 [Salinisphaera hydrothermalis C41B8]
MPAETSAALPIEYDTVHQAADGQRDALVDELVHRGSQIVDDIDSLIFTRDVPGPAAWAQNTWLAPREYRVDSIGDAARRLTSIQRNWHLHSIAHHRRARLIADKLPPIRFKPLEFPAFVPSAPLGSFALLDRDRLLASPVCSSAFADGHPIFAEDRTGPPNRAYLKLWEALTLARRRPGPGDVCLELGASPGGWTWVLDRLGAEIIAVDRADLAPQIMASTRVTTWRGDAFGVTVDDLERPPDWILSDVIAYPSRLLDLADYWCHACPHAAVIITVKCQGMVDPAEISRFLDIKNARLCHLAANKHELTFFRLPEGGPPEAVFRGPDPH